MEYRKENDTPGKILVSHERNLLRISVPAKMDAQEIRLLLDRMADSAEHIFIPSEMVKESYGYTFFIRQRHSLKEYLSENSLSFCQYAQLVKAIISLKLLADKMNVCIYHFLFDYDAILIGKSTENPEFLYTPCDIVCMGDNSISEMLTILSLHLSDQEDEASRAVINKSVQLLAKWEAEPDSVFPTAELNELFQWENKQNTEKKQSWRPFLLFQTAAFFIFLLFNILLPMDEFGFYFTLAWLLLVVCVDFFLVPGLRPQRQKHIPASLSRQLWIIGPHIFKKYRIEREKDTVRIGRDTQWANVISKNLLVSRRHAEIFCQGGDLFLRDLHSQNGTYIDSQKISPDEPFRLTDTVSFSIGEGRLAYCAEINVTRFPLPSVLKYMKKRFHMEGSRSV